MRVQKFRAWDKNRKKMIFGPTDDNVSSGWVYTMATASPYEDMVVLMESTGIMDKNKIEIFEGDICKLNGGAKDVFFEVAYEYGCFVARVPWKKEHSPELKAYCYFDSEVMIVEVVGNIYEDPELLTHDT
jgi:uncharacterized phage protein (TIGR01671 family)